MMKYNIIPILKDGWLGADGLGGHVTWILRPIFIIQYLIPILMGLCGNGYGGRGVGH